MPLSWSIERRKAWFRYLTENEECRAEHDRRMGQMESYERRINKRRETGW